MMNGYWDGSSFWWGGMIFGPLIMIAFVVLTVLAIAWALRATGFGWRPERREPSALDILSGRFARGEIDRAEYEDRRKLLSGP
jgi:putative membrane protein